MGDMLSQAEIDALLGGSSYTPEEPSPASDMINTDDVLTSEQKDILGEIGNISMGTSATTLFALLNQKVWITTPVVSVVTWGHLANGYQRPCVGIRVDYKEGLMGSNILILNERDVKIIANLMMAGDGEVDDSLPLSELDLSAIGEAMNQMVGSSSTSLSSMIQRKIDIDTPRAFLLDFSDMDFFDNTGFTPDDIVACVSFRMEIGTLIDSQIMQILPVDFAIDMVETLKSNMSSPAPEPPKQSPPPAMAQQAAPQQAMTQAEIDAAMNAAMPHQQQPQFGQPSAPPQYQQPVQPQYQQPPQQPISSPYEQPVQYQQPMPYQQPYPYPPYQQVNDQQAMYQQQFNQPQYQQPQPQPQFQPPPQNIQAAQFQSFDVGEVMRQKENIGIIMDVPLEVTVELGRTYKKIKDILEFSPGSIIELDKLAGEPIDILVNGKFVAKGEVVVIDENFGIRITDIISVDKRI